MLNKYATFLANKLAKQTETTEENDIYVYGFELLLSILLTMLILFIISSFLGNPLHSLIFFFFFFILRLFCGGLHADSHFKCILMTSIIFIFTILFSKFLLKNNFTLLIVVSLIVSLILIFFFAPVVNIKHPISEKTYVKNKRISRFLSIISFMILLLIIFRTNFIDIGIIGGLSFIEVSILITIEKFKERRVRNEKS